MKNLALCIAILSSFVLLGCGKPQPSEEQKARIDGESIMQCLVLVNRNPDDIEKSIFSAFALLAEATDKLSSISEKDWELLDADSELILTSFTQGSVDYDCEFSLLDGVELQKVKRNGEEVYNKVINDGIVQEIERKKAEKEASELKARKEKEAAELKARKEKEAAELKARKEKEAAELKRKLETWIEKDYSNVSYSYYEKHHNNSKAKYDDETIAVVCDPDYARVKFDDGNLHFSGQEKVEFKFHLKNGKNESHRFDLTSNGGIGIKVESSYMTRIGLSKERNSFFIKKLKESKAIEVNNLIFNMNDVTQIPCI